jgi:DNA-binding transcriptional MerR regulator
MRSAELARLAGVSVRTLRHYHQVGLLAEPERDFNGYRRYDVHDLVRVLRIRRLAALGMALDQMAPLLDGEPDSAAGILEDLDKELAGLIDRLEEQRRIIAQLKERDVPPDLPPEYAPFFEAYLKHSPPSKLVAIDRDQAILLAGLASAEDNARIGELYQAMASDESLPAVIELSERFDQLAADTPEADLRTLATEYAARLAPLVAEFGGQDEPGELASLGPSADLLVQHAADLMNPAQRRLLELVESMLA